MVWGSPHSSHCIGVSPSWDPALRGYEGRGAEPRTATLNPSSRDSSLVRQLGEPIHTLQLRCSVCLPGSQGGLMVTQQTDRTIAKVY